MARKILNIIFCAILIILAMEPFSVHALEISKYENLPVKGDFVVGPGSFDIVASPGETTTREMNITNRTGKILDVKIDIEDFTGDPNYGTKLLGEDKGPYSLKDFLIPESMEFKLAHGEKALLPIKISVPQNAEPGGLYGSVIVRVDPVVDANNPNNPEDSGTGVSISSRIASLFYVRIKGEARTEGKLLSFSTDKKFYQKSPVNFSVNYENTGRVHLTPYATIEITNMMGKKIDELDVPPFFVMPGFTRTRVVNWDKGLAFGRYTATVKANRGYQDLVDKQVINFWIIPLKILIISLSVIVLLAALIIWFSSKFELKKKE